MLHKASWAKRYASIIAMKISALSFLVLTLSVWAVGTDGNIELGEGVSNHVPAFDNSQADFLKDL